jgi:hypothetical protein
MPRSDFVVHSRPESARTRFPISPRPRARRAVVALCAAAFTMLAACADDTDTAVDTGAAAGAMETGGAETAGIATLANYDLTMDQVDKYFAAFRNMGAAMQRMSPQERETLEFDASNTDFNGYVARLEAHPVIERAIRDAGLSAREFSLVLWSMLQSSMANAVLQAQPDANEDSLARAMQVNMNNVRFMREHEGEIRQKQEALDQEMQEMGVVEEDGTP